MAEMAEELVVGVSFKVSEPTSRAAKEAVDHVRDSAREAEAAIKGIDLGKPISRLDQEIARLTAHFPKGDGWSDTFDLGAPLSRLDQQIEELTAHWPKGDGWEDTLSLPDPEQGPWAEAPKAAFALTAAIVALSVEAYRAGDAAHDLGVRLGVSAEDAQELSYVADRSATSIDALTQGMTTLQRQLGAARDGSKEAAKALKTVGVDPKQIKSASDALPLLADGLAKIKDEGERAQVRMVLLGEAGPRMAELLGRGSKGIDELTANAHRFGGVISEADADLSGDFLDSLSDLGMLARSAGRELAFELLPHLDAVVGGVHDWWEANADVIGQRMDTVADATGRSLGRLAGPLKGLTVAAGAAAAAMGSLGLARSMATATAAASPLAASLLATASAAGAAAFAAAPYLAVVGALGLAIDDLDVAADNGDSAFLRLADAMGVRSEAYEAARDMRDMLGEMADVAGALAGAIGTELVQGLQKLGAYLPALEPYLRPLIDLMQMSLGDVLGNVAEGAREASSGGKYLANNLRTSGLSGLGDVFFPGSPSDPSSSLYVPTPKGLVNAAVTVQAAPTPQQIADAAGEEVRRQTLDALTALGGVGL